MAAPGQLLERAGELETALAAAVAARDGDGRLLAVVGPAGIGKTRFLAAVTEHAGDIGMRVLRARAGELERAFPFGVARQVVEPPLSAADPAERGRLLAGAAELAEEVVDPAVHGPGAAADPSFAALHGLFWLTANLAERRPLLLVVDDAHWCDPPSLRWLAYMARRLEGMPVLLGMSWRPSEPGSDTGPLDELAADPSTVVVRPPPLSPDASAELLAALADTLPDPEFAAACHDVTGGNPYLLGEIAAMVSGDGIDSTAANAELVRRLGPGSVSRSMLSRLGRLGPAAVALARAVAVLEGGAELRQVVALSGLDDAEIADVADRLARAAILKPARPLEFEHPIVREAIYADIGPLARAREHARAADVLAAAGAAPATVAAHLVETEPEGDARVVHRLRAAARDAFGRGAPETARRFLTRAATEPPPAEVRGAVLHELGLAEMASGSTDALRHLTEAVELSADHRERAERARVLAQTLVFAGRAEDAVAIVADAVDSLPEDERDLGLELEAYLWVSGYVSQPARRLVLDRAPRFRISSGDARGLALAATALESALTEGDAPASVALALRALDEGRLLAAAGADSPPFYMAANTLLYADDLPTAQHVYTDAADQAARRGSIQGFGSAIAWRAVTNLRAGAIGDADADARHFLRTAAEVVPIGVPLVACAAIEVLIARGEIDEAGEVADRNADAFGPYSSLTLMALESRARLRLAQGDAGQALADFEECGRREEAWGFTNPALTLWRSGAALAHLALGREADARRLAHVGVEQARAYGARRPLGMALRAAGLVEGDTASVRESVDVLARSDARLEHAVSLLELGAALRRAGRRADARPPLSSALAEARRCEAVGVASRAHDELVATGARPRRILRGGADALTASERRIARMARSGLSNREIAQALFVTVRTVEVHLSHAYRKLDIRSRDALDRVLPE